MRKLILALSICALIPMVSIAVAYADDDEDIEYVEEDEDIVDTDENYVEEPLGESAENESVVEAEDEPVLENRVVAKRMTCDDIKKEMDRLGALSELDEEQTEQLNGLKTDYRSRCSKKTGAARRGAGRSKAKATVNAVAATSNAKAQATANAGCENPDANGCCPGETYTDLGDDGFLCCTENNECFQPAKVKKTLSLCEDGSKPDKNGCCKGETYTDLGEQGFNCCQSDKVTCFPPLK